jgi:hypothetical protein
MLRRLFAFFIGFGAVVGCAVYDESLLPTKPPGGGGEGGTIGTGGNQPPTDGGAGAGGATTDGAGGSVVGSGGASGSGTGGIAPPIDSGQPDVATGAGGSVASDASDAPSRTDVVDAHIVDSSDVSMIPMCPLLIDDMETGSGHVQDPQGCRNGYWFTYNDGGGTQTPAMTATFAPIATMPARAGSLYAAHTNGMGFPVYAGVGVSLNNPNNTIRGTYDASAYSGVSFWARGSGQIAFEIPNKDTDPNGQICATADRGLCNDHFATVPPIALNAAWTFYSIPFSSLRQQGYGYVPPGGFDRRTIYALEWQVSGAAAFDIWIDDLSFTVATPDGGVQ